MAVNQANRVLTAKGYALRKDFLSPAQTMKIRQELTVAPAVPEKYSKGGQHFPVYAESDTRFYVPRQWGYDNFGEPEVNTVPEGIDLKETAVQFNGTPYDYQEQIVSKFIDSGACGLICVPCGRGKTFMALYTALWIGKRFLVVVDKEFLMNQWRDEIKAFCPNIRIGILQGSKIQTEAENFDCTICMLQSVYPKEFPVGFFKDYGFTIFDECHKLGAQQFSRVLAKIQTKYMLGLSATPDRDDGLTKVFEWYIGRPIYQEKVRDPDPTVIVRAVWFRSDDDAYLSLPTDWKGEVVTARLLGQICDFEPRIKKVIEIIKEICRDNRRQLLVLSERKELLGAYEEGILAGQENECGDGDRDGGRPWKFRIGYYIGGMKDEKLKENATGAQILLATYAMASEALNIKTLNAVILATPRKKIEQSTGRILRLRPEQRVVEPIIYDIIDQHETYVRQWWVRQRYYKQCTYSIEHIGKASKVKDSTEDVAKFNECVIQL
jgi:hypothetical protein